MTSGECKAFESKQSPYDSSRSLQEHRKTFERLQTPYDYDTMTSRRGKAF
jgi:hypothetical protein